METKKPSRKRLRGMYRVAELLIAVICILSASTAVAAEDKDFYSSGQILPGEEWDEVNIYNDDTIVDMLGGSCDWIGTHDKSTLNIYDGYADVEVFSNSTINMSGGYIGYIKGWNNTSINFFSSFSATSLVAENSAEVYITGGLIGNIHAYSLGKINLSGGSVSGVIVAYDNATINIYGYDLIKTTSGGDYGYGRVYGFLSDDTYIYVSLHNPEAYDHIYFIPEPASLILLAFGSLLLRRKR